VDYVLGRKIGAKGSQTSAHSELLAEGEGRADRGAGVVWSPSAGEGKRASSLYAFGVTSLATAGLELQALAQASRSFERFGHIVFSFAHDPGISDEKMIETARRVLKRKGWLTAGVLAVHRDQPAPHVHCAILMADPVTLRPVDRHYEIDRLHRHTREVEIELGLYHEFGNYVIRGEPGLERIEKSTRPERIKHRQKLAEESLERLQRHSPDQYAQYEKTFEEYADRSVAPRLLEYLSDENCEHNWVDLHLIAAKYGTRVGDDIFLGLSLEHEDKVVSFEAVGLDQRAIEKELGAYLDFAHAQEAYLKNVERNPALVLREITCTRAIFTRETLHRHLLHRVSDYDDLEDVSQAILRHADVIALEGSLDTPYAIFTTRQVRNMERELHADADHLAQATDERYDPELLARCIDEAEAARGFTLSEEQRRAISHLERKLSVIQGNPGSGKTEIMDVVRRYAAAGKREIVGLTTAQGAAEKLFGASGIKSYNSARAAILERMSQRVIPEGGFVAVDESGMVGDRSMRYILGLARERNCTVLTVGDTKQLQPIEAGNPFRILHEVGKANGTYEEMGDIRRQRDALEWMRGSLRRLGEAFEQGDEDGIRAALSELEAHGVIEWAEDRDDLILRAARLHLENLKRFGAHDARLIAPTRDGARHMSQAVRTLRGCVRTGPDGVVHEGHSYRTIYGMRQFTVRDRIVFRRNEEYELFRTERGFAAKVTNGELGTVVSHQRYRLVVDLDRGERVHFDPRKYKDFDWGYGITTHSVQGASPAASVATLDPSANAANAFVALSRGHSVAKLIVSREDFGDLDGLAHHLAHRIELKSTTYHTMDEVRKYGGAELRHAAPDDPVREEYEREMQVRFKAGLLETERLRQHYAAKFGAGWERQHMSDWQREAERILQRHAPENFGRWLHREREGEVYEQRMDDYNYKRSTELKIENDKLSESATGGLKPPRLGL